MRTLGYDGYSRRQATPPLTLSLRQIILPSFRTLTPNLGFDDIPGLMSTSHPFDALRGFRSSTDLEDEISSDGCDRPCDRPCDRAGAVPSSTYQQHDEDPCQ